VSSIRPALPESVQLPQEARITNKKKAGGRGGPLPGAAEILSIIGTSLSVLDHLKEPYDETGPLTPSAASVQGFIMPRAGRAAHRVMKGGRRLEPFLLLSVAVAMGALCITASVLPLEGSGDERDKREALRAF
jgi:hypothetical protein